MFIQLDKNPGSKGILTLNFLSFERDKKRHNLLCVTYLPELGVAHCDRVHSDQSPHTIHPHRPVELAGRRVFEYVVHAAKEK